MARKQVTTAKRSSKRARLTVPPRGYAATLAVIKARVRAAQVGAALSVNRELIGLYWEIGKAIVERQTKEGWGKSVVDSLAVDLQHEFPGESGFSPQNVWKMRQFYSAWTDDVLILSQPVRELIVPQIPALLFGLPWGQNTEIIFKIKDPLVRLWYAEQTVANGWSRAVLLHQIDTSLHERQGKAITNFAHSLPSPQSDLAQQVLKDPYCIGFLSLVAEAKERDLERGLLDHLRDFLLELGVGFAFVGSQVRIVVAGREFSLDLLFYHLHLRCYVVIDLKVEEFQPEHAGKMEFYLSAVDDQFRHANDQPTIGLILCKERNRVVVEYTLRRSASPVGVASYETRGGKLPASLRDKLPGVKELQEELRRVDDTP